MLSKTIAVTFFLATQEHIKAEELAEGGNNNLTPTERCYKKNYYDLGKMSPKEHYEKIGKAQNRFWGCGRRVSDWNAMNYLNQSPELQEQYGFEGERAIDGAHKEFAASGYKQSDTRALRTSKEYERFAVSEHQKFKCSGNAYYMTSKRPDTNQNIKRFNEAILFDYVKLSRPNELITCNNQTFGRDPHPGIQKGCYCEPAYQYPVETGRKCATEGGNCTCEPGKVVLYGQNKSVKRGGNQIARWNEIFLVNGGKSWTGKQVGDKTSIPCNNREFGDPLKGTQKACFCVKQNKLITNKLKSIGKYQEALKKEEESEKTRSVAVQRVAVINRSVKASQIKRQEAVQKTSSQITTQTATSCTTKCSVSTQQTKSTLVKTVITEKYDTMISVEEQKIVFINHRIEEAHAKKESAIKIKAVAEKSKDPTDQAKLKREYETLEQEANSVEIQSTMELKETMTKIETLKKEKNSQLAKVDEEVQVNIQKDLEKAKKDDAETLKAQNEITVKQNESIAKEAKDKVEVESFENKALQQTIEAENEKKEAITVMITSLQQEKEDGDNKIATIDGGESLSAQKEEELTKSTNEIIKQVEENKSHIKEEIEKNTVKITEAETEFGEATVYFEEKKQELQEVQNEIAGQKIAIQAAENALEQDPKNQTAQVLLVNSKKQLDTEKEILIATQNEVKKTGSTIQQLNTTISSLTVETKKKINETEVLEINLANKNSQREQAKLERELAKKVDTAVKDKNSALESKLEYEVKVAQEKTIEAEHMKSIEKIKKDQTIHNETISKVTKEIASLKGKVTTLETGAGAGKTVNQEEVIKIKEEITKKQNKIDKENEIIKNNEERVDNYKKEETVLKEQIKQLETEVKTKEETYTNVTKTVVKEETEDLKEVETKNTQAKEVLKKAKETSDKVTKEEGKKVNQLKNKIVGCKGKLQKANKRINILQSQLEKVNNNIKEFADKPNRLANNQERRTKILAEIAQQKQIKEESATCIKTETVTLTNSKEEIAKAQEAASEAQLISKQTEELKELVKAQIENTKQIEQSIEGELTQQWNSTEEKVSELVKEEAQLQTKVEESKVTITKTENTISQKKKEVQELETSIQTTTTQIEQLKTQISDPKEAEAHPEIVTEVKELTSQIEANKQKKVEATQAVNSNIKTMEEAKQTITESEEKNNTIIEKINSVKNVAVTESITKNYKTAVVDHKITDLNHQKEQLEVIEKQTKEHLAVVENKKKTQEKTVGDHTSTLKEQEKILKELETQVDSEKAIGETTNKTEEKITKIKETIDNEKKIIEETKEQIVKIQQEQKTDETKLIDVASKKQNNDQDIKNTKEKAETLVKITQNEQKEVLKQQRETQTAVNKQREMEKKLEEAEQTKKVAEEKVVENTATIEEATKKEATIENEIKTLNEKLTTNTTISQEESTKIKNTIDQKKTEKKNVQVTKKVAEKEKSDLVKEVSTTESEVNSAQTKVTETKETVSQMTTSAQQTVTIIEESQKEEVTNIIDNNKDVQEQIESLQKELKLVDTKIAETVTEKEVSDKELVTETIEMNQALETAEVAKTSTEFSECQALFYNTPETKRKALFTPVQTQNFQCKETNLKYVRMMAFSLGVSKQDLGAFYTEAFKLYQDGYISSLQMRQNNANVTPDEKAGYKILNKDDKLSYFEVFFNQGKDISSPCDVQDLLEKTFVRKFATEVSPVSAFFPGGPLSNKH